MIEIKAIQIGVEFFQIHDANEKKKRIVCLCNAAEMCHASFNIYFSMNYMAAFYMITI